MHLLDHVARSSAALDLAGKQFDASERRLSECRVEAAGRAYDRARDLPGLLPRWKFLADAIEGRSSPLAIVEELDRAIAHERKCLNHWSRGGDTSRIFNLRVARAGEIAAMQESEAT